jgi:hypothetical protein
LSCVGIRTVDDGFECHTPSPPADATSGRTTTNIRRRRGHSTVARRAM